MTSVIEARDLTFAYDGRPVVEDVSLSVQAGEFLGIVGPNGGGKTTLLQLLLGLRTPDSGTVEIFGTPASRFNAGERLGYVSQHATETGRRMPITVREVVRMGRYPHAGLNGLDEADEALVDRALETAGITALADERIGNLSGGQTQRTYIARVLAAEAEILALDEPTVGVDAEGRDRFYELLGELHDDGVTILLVDHDLDVVTQNAERMVCINRTIRYDGRPAGFFESDALRETFGRAGEALAALQ